jgi:hypothetical protein
MKYDSAEEVYSAEEAYNELREASAQRHVVNL